MLTTLATLILATVPCGDVLVDRCDVVEHNRFFDEEGRLEFEQVIFYDIIDRQMIVRAWRLVKSPSIVPVRDHRTGDYVSLWIDGICFREVRAPIFRESWTQYDPELVNREILPKEKRRELSTPWLIKDSKAQ